MLFAASALIGAGCAPGPHKKAAGELVDKDTGKPVRDATVILVSQTLADAYSSVPVNRPTLTTVTSDAKGKYAAATEFALKEIVVLHPDYHPESRTMFEKRLALTRARKPQRLREGKFEGWQVGSRHSLLGDGVDDVEITRWPAMRAMPYGLPTVRFLNGGGCVLVESYESYGSRTKIFLAPEQGYVADLPSAPHNDGIHNFIYVFQLRGGKYYGKMYSFDWSQDALSARFKLQTQPGDRNLEDAEYCEIPSYERYEEYRRFKF